MDIKKLPIACIALACIALTACKAQPAPKLALQKDDNTLLWQISGNGLKKPSYLFGTFHLMCKSDIHISKQLQDALSFSTEVYFEMDLDDAANTLGGMFFMNMKDSTLQQVLSPEDYTKVEKFFKDSLRMGLTAFKKMKPMMLSTLMYPKLMACKQQSGVEMELMALATKQKKEIKGFETIQFQASIFDSIPYSVQAKALIKSIDSITMYKQYFNTLVQTYKEQNLAKIEKVLSDTTFNEGEDNDIMLKNRNLNWVNQLESILKKNNIFMAVGAAHLVGKDGVIALLRKKGYKVEALRN
jgi:uncharacterized protein